MGGEMSVKIGSLFSGVGGFELGLERAISGAETVWQVEQNPFCQKVLAKHWPKAKIYNDVKNITADKVEAVDILCGGFPCQDISLAGKKEGLHGKKSGLWWEMLRIISELSAGRKKPIVVLENVAAISVRGGCEVVGSLAEIGYCTEWTIISARDFGAPHLRRRWFAVAYPDSYSKSRCSDNAKTLAWISADSDSKPKPQTDQAFDTFGESGYTWEESSRSNRRDDASDSDSIRPGQTWDRRTRPPRREGNEIQRRRSQKSTDFDSTPCERRGLSCGVHKKNSNSNHSFSKAQYWGETSSPAPLCRVDDGIPNRLDRLRALGNAIVPQCSEWVGQQIVKSGLLEDLL